MPDSKKAPLTLVPDAKGTFSFYYNYFIFLQSRAQSSSLYQISLCFKSYPDAQEATISYEKDIIFDSQNLSNTITKGTLYEKNNIFSTYYNADDEPMWYVKVTGTFTFIPIQTIEKTLTLTCSTGVLS